MITSPEQMTKQQRINWVYQMDARRMIEYDIMDCVKTHMGIPEEWHEIWKDEDRRDPKRTRVTIRMDADVVKFFRAMGEGYQVRINRVLRYFMHLRLAGLVEGPDVNDFVLRPENFPEDGRRSEWGAAMATYDELRRSVEKNRMEGRAGWDDGVNSHT